MALWNLFHDASLLTTLATSIKSDPQAYCLERLGYIIRIEMVSTLISFFARFQEKQICSMNCAAPISLRAIVSDFLQTEGNSKVAIVCMLKYERVKKTLSIRMVLQLLNSEQGRVNVVGPSYCLCESLAAYVQRVIVSVWNSASKALLPLSSCVPGMAFLEPHTRNKQTLWALLYAGLWLQPDRVQGDARWYLPSMFFCGALYRKRFILEIPERVIKHIIFTTGRAHLPPKPGGFDTKSPGTCL